MRSGITGAILLIATTFHVVFGCCAYEAASCYVPVGTSRSMWRACAAVDRGCRVSFGHYLLVLPGMRQWQLGAGGSHAHQHDQHAFRCWFEHCRFVSESRHGGAQRLKLRRLLIIKQARALAHAPDGRKRVQLLSSFACQQSLPTHDRSVTQVWLL